MKNDTTMDRLMEQWPDLKKRAEDETDTEKLIAVLYEIEDFLVRFEARVVANDQERLRADTRPDNLVVRTGIGHE
jgi:hypothetical protein